jgi:hypothetical protein
MLGKRSFSLIPNTDGDGLTAVERVLYGQESIYSATHMQAGSDFLGSLSRILSCNLDLTDMKLLFVFILLYST